MLTTFYIYSLNNKLLDQKIIYTPNEWIIMQIMMVLGVLFIIVFIIWIDYKVKHCGE